jgi:hypothetical protein
MSNTERVKQKRDVQLNIPCTRDELARIHAIADARCLPTATFVRSMLLRGNMSDPV